MFELDNGRSLVTKMSTVDEIRKKISRDQANLSKEFNLKNIEYKN